MVSHGLITAALFLLAGVFYTAPIAMTWTPTAGWLGRRRSGAALFAVGAFASLGLPAFSGFIAEFQIFAGSIATSVAAIALCHDGMAGQTRGIVMVLEQYYIECLSQASYLIGDETTGRAARGATSAITWPTLNGTA